MTGRTTGMLINCTSAVNQTNSFYGCPSYFIAPRAECFPASRDFYDTDFFQKTAESKHSPVRSHSAGTAALEGNESATFSSAELKIFQRFLKKETASEETKGEVMTASLLQSKLSLLESATEREGFLWF